MDAEVIAVGDELTNGQRLDTNSQWLSQRLGDLGVRVSLHTTVGDDLAANVAVFRGALERADVVVCTGGLGPTADDLTRQALAEATGAPLVLDESVLAHIRRFFANRQRAMPPANAVQAMFPRGSRVIPNPYGTAPGIDMEVSRPEGSSCRIFALPGVPAEMRDMWRQTVQPALQAAGGGGRRLIRHRCIHCFGMGESDVEQMLPELTRRGRRPTVGITASQATITLRITAEADSQEACDAVIEPTVSTIRQRLGSLVFGEGDDQLQHVVVRMLADRGQSLATAEWALGGLLAHWLSDAAHGGAAYLGGFVFHDAAAAGRFAGLATDIATPGTDEGLELTRRMADACRRRHGAVYGLAVGPIPQTDSASSTVPVLHYALAGSSGVTAQSCPFLGHPELVRARGAKQALNFVRLSLDV